MSGRKKENTKEGKKKAVGSARKQEKLPEDGSSGAEATEADVDDVEVEQNEKENETSENVNKSHKTKKPAKNNKQTIDQTDGIRQSNKNNIIFLLITSIAVLSGLSLFNSSSSKDSVTIDIERVLTQLANDYKNQSQFSYKKLKSRMTSYVRHKTSPQPFVLMVASAQDNQHTAECFANRIAKLLTATTVIINGSNYTDAQAADAKNDIDILLRDTFRKGMFPTAAIIHNFDSIPYGTTSLFYAYCDHDHPMYKEATIIFTVTLPHSYQISSSEVDREGLVGRYLSEDIPWVKDKEFRMDVVGALISRITDTVIVVNKENEESLENSC